VTGRYVRSYIRDQCGVVYTHSHFSHKIRTTRACHIPSKPRNTRYLLTLFLTHENQTCGRSRSLESARFHSLSHPDPTPPNGCRRSDLYCQEIAKALPSPLRPNCLRLHPHLGTCDHCTDHGSTSLRPPRRSPPTVSAFLEHHLLK